jgi:hypothetical protein
MLYTNPYFFTYSNYKITKGSEITIFAEYLLTESHWKIILQAMVKN